MPDNTPWKIDFFDEEIKTEYEIYFKKHSDQKSVKMSFEKDVTINPYYHPKPKRIIPLKGKYKGQYRYKKSDTRIIYQPDSATQKIYPLETGTATNISYKVKSKKK
jgi:mRNA-degrading endonuclease RelE of RelBE toxin-antitoxin system